jgi:hypothetical protein
MSFPPRGCAKRNLPLTLWFVAPDRKPTPVAGTFVGLPCGRVFEPRIPNADCYGIALCGACARSAGFLGLG